MNRRFRLTGLPALLLVVLLFSCRNGSDGSSAKYNHPGWSKNSVIYEVNIRQYTPGGTFNEFAQHLPRLKDMGVDILWLMPVNPIGEKNRKGSLGSYYSVKDYMKVNPEYGTMDDFKNLVKAAHQSGMKIIIDWVANHTSWDNPLITEHPEFYRKDSTGKIIAPVPDWTDVAALDYNVPALREYMKDAMLFWIKEADIDGFRCDVAGMLPISFWNKTVPELRKQKSDIFMLAEAESPEMHDTAFDMTYSWDLFHTMKGIYKGEKRVDNIDSVLAKDTAFPVGALRMRFTQNHDENSWAGTENDLFGDASETFAAMTFLLPGMPLIYSGQEAGLNKKLRFFDKDTINWTDLSKTKFYTELIKLKKSHPALYNGTAGGDLIKIENDQPSRVYSFIRKNGDDEVVAIFNLSGEATKVTIKSKELKGKWIGMNGQEVSAFTDIDLQPWEWMVLVNN